MVFAKYYNVYSEGVYYGSVLVILCVLLRTLCSEVLISQAFVRRALFHGVQM